MAAAGLSAATTSQKVSLPHGSPKGWAVFAGDLGSHYFPTLKIERLIGVAMV